MIIAIMLSSFSLSLHFVMTFLFTNFAKTTLSWYIVYYRLSRCTFSHLTIRVLQTVVRKMADDKALQFTSQHVIASIFLRKYCSFEMIDIILLQRKACRFRPIVSVFHLTRPFNCWHFTHRHSVVKWMVVLYNGN